MIKRTMIQMLALNAIVAMALFACGGGSTEPAQSSQRPSPPPPPPAAAPSQQSEANSSSSEATGKAFAVVMQDQGGSGAYIFDPKNMEFNNGDTISFELSSETEFHSFTVEELGIDFEVDGGTSEIFTFTFDKPGSYSLICIPHETLGMVGTITVK